MPHTTFSFERYLNIRAAYAGSLSPDGQRLAFLTDITGVPQVWSLAINPSLSRSEWPEQLTFFSERVSFVAYAPDGSYLIMGMDAGGNERQQLYKLTLDGSEVTPLTDKPEVIYQFGGWSRDGKHIAIASNERDARFFDVYMCDIQQSNSEFKMVMQNDNMNHPVGWSPDGTKLLVARYFSNLENELHIIDLPSGDITRLAPRKDGVQARYEEAQFTSDGKGLYLLSDEDRDYMALAYYDFASQEMTYLWDKKWDTEGIALTESGDKLAVVTNEDGYSRLAIYDVTGGWQKLVPIHVPSLPACTIGSLDWSRNGKRLSFTVNGSRYNPDVWLLDLEVNRVWQVTHSSRAGIPQDTFVVPELVHFESFDDLEIPAFLYRPQNAAPDQPLPVVIHVHGGPEAQSRPIFFSAIQYLLQHGYAILDPNVRGSTGYGKAYSHLDDIRLRMDSVKDLEYAVKWLKDSHIADPSRIAVMGGSYGGFMVLAALTAYPSLWTAGIDIVGIANFVTFLENTGPWRRKLREAEYGSLEEDREFLEEISPLHKAHEITAALMVVHGANDPRVPVGEAEQIVKAVQDRGGDVSYMLFEDEGHGVIKRHNRIKAYTAMAEFLDKHLRGV